MKHFLAFTLLFQPAVTLADLYSYECEVLGEYVHDEKGTLVLDRRIYVGEKFNVERRSGVVLGGGVGNSSYPTKQVLDPGGKEQSYKLIWISKDVSGTTGGKNVVYLNIEEFAESEKKSFVLFEGSRVLSGLCK